MLAILQDCDYLKVVSHGRPFARRARLAPDGQTKDAWASAGAEDQQPSSSHHLHQILQSVTIGPWYPQEGPGYIVMRNGMLNDGAPSQKMISSLRWCKDLGLDDLF